TPIRPSAAASATSSRGYAPDASMCAACGATRSRANVRTRSRNSVWSEEREKSTGELYKSWSLGVLESWSPGVRASGLQAFRTALKRFPHPRGGVRQLFWQRAGFADHGHEVRVAIPARDDVHVQVIENARAGR